MTKITHLFFDIGGVCLTNGWDHISREKAADFFGYVYRESDERHQKVVEKFETGEISRESYLNEVVFYKKRNFTEKEFIKFMESQSQVHPGSIEVLKKLCSQGNYHVSTLNNESLELNLFRIEKFGLNKYFSNFFSSSFLAVKKPETPIFQKVLWITQTSGKQCLMIDDREENLEGAARCGFQTLHLPEVKDLERKLIERKILI